MIFGLFVLAVALAISAVAAYYSIAGLTAIFAAAVVPIIIMGASLEAGKIVATVWLHRYWHRASWQFKAYLVPAIVILMLITSMGIFGFLSKAHMDQTVTVGDSASKVAILDEKISTEKSNIDSAKKALQQMDSQVDQLLGRTTDDKGANRAVQVRKQQAKERKALQDEIAQAQKTVIQLQNERAPLAAETRKIEAEVGPIKYIAALIYGDNPDANLLERAVRWVIILLVFVFDPLALVLILAAEQTLIWAREDRKKQQDLGLNIPLPDDDAVVTDFFARGKGLARRIDAANGTLSDDDLAAMNIVPPKEEDIRPFTEEEVAALEKPTEEITEPLDTTPEQHQTAPMEVVHDLPHADPPPLRGFQPPATDEEPLNPIPKPVIVNENQIIIPSMIASDNEQPTNAGFGTEFPRNPQRGDLFLRVDFLPSKLYKWNERKWIEVSKDSTDQYAYDPEYIKHLIDKIDCGEYDVETLSILEQEQIQRYLNENSNTK